MVNPYREPSPRDNYPPDDPPSAYLALVRDLTRLIDRPPPDCIGSGMADLVESGRYWMAFFKELGI